MEDDLDHILLEQLYLARKRLRVVRRHLKLMPTDIWLNEGIIIIRKKIEFYENMIQNKELLMKKIKKKKQQDVDILSRSPIYTLYRDVMIISNIGYKFFIDIAQSYISLYISKKKEKQ